MEFKYCEDTRPENQLQRATQQHAQLLTHLRDQGYHKVELQAILSGVMGTIYTKHTDEPLHRLGLDYHQIKTLTHLLNKHAIQCATQLMNTRNNKALHKANCGQDAGLGASARNPPDPH